MAPGETTSPVERYDKNLFRPFNIQSICLSLVQNRSWIRFYFLCSNHNVEQQSVIQRETRISPNIFGDSGCRSGHQSRLPPL